MVYFVECRKYVGRQLATQFCDELLKITNKFVETSGHFVRARVSRVAGNWQPREAEALNLKESLSWVKELNYDYCVFEYDSKQLVDTCNGQEGESYFHTIVSDCVVLCKHFNHVLVQFVGRSANGVAHLLANHFMSGLREWDVHPPEFIHHEI